MNFDTKGFTVPELLVALLVFSFVIGGAANLLISGIAGQRNSLAMQELLDQTSFVAEYMSRHLRQAQKDLDGTCVSPAGSNYQIFPGGSGIKFINVNGQCQQFVVLLDRIYEDIGGNTLPLTGDNLTVTLLEFVIQGEGQNDNLQPRVTFAFEIEGQGASGQSKPKLQFQTTLSQRNVDVPK